MKNKKIILVSTTVFVGLSALSLLYVSVLSLINPQATMDLVNITLPNTDAISSIRGIYGGAGLTITLTIAWLFKKNPRWALSFLALFWGSYALSRLVTMVIDGSLGPFGNQWVIIESTFSFISIILLKYQTSSSIITTT